jgi:hypothetical protein
MADNRMFLVHVTTGLAVPLARRSNSHWTTSSDGALLETLFTVLGADGLDDDFLVIMENPGPSEQRTGWSYGPRREDGLRQILWDEPVTS